LIDAIADAFKHSIIGSHLPFKLYVD